VVGGAVALTALAVVAVAALETPTNRLPTSSCASQLGGPLEELAERVMVVVMAVGRVMVGLDSEKAAVEAGVKAVRAERTAPTNRER